MIYFKSKEFKERGLNMKHDKLLATAKVSSQGQVTLPKIVRAKLNIKNGEIIIFTINENNEVKIKNANDLEITHIESESENDGK